MSDEPKGILELVADFGAARARDDDGMDEFLAVSRAVSALRADVARLTAEREALLELGAAPWMMVTTADPSAKQRRMNVAKAVFWDKDPGALARWMEKAK